MRSLNDRLQDRQTPRGREIERRAIKLDCNILSVGALGLFLASPWLLVPGAMAHLIVNFVGSHSKIRWALATSIYLAAIGVIVALVDQFAAGTIIGDWVGSLIAQPGYVVASGIVV